MRVQGDCTQSCAEKTGMELKAKQASEAESISVPTENSICDENFRIERQKQLYRNDFWLRF